jgi:hypothetical protein
MGWKIRGSNPGRGKRFYSSPKHPDRLWGPPCLLVNRYRGMKLTTELLLTPRFRISEAIVLLPVYGFMEWTGTTLLVLKSWHRYTDSAQ